MKLNRRTWLPIALLAVGSMTFAGVSQAQVMKQGTGLLHSLSFSSDRLRMNEAIEPLEDVHSNLSSNIQSGWAGFQSANGQWQAVVDKRHGQVSLLEGAGIPFIPGKGNTLSATGKGVVTLSTLETAARAFLPQVQGLLGIDPRSLVLNLGRSGQPASHVWFVDFDVMNNGAIIENARVVLRINNGNLIQVGSENLPAAGAVAPRVQLAKSDALNVVSKYIGGFNSTDTFADSGSLHLVPINNPADSRFADGFAFGQGRGLANVYQFTFHRDGVMGNWRARVDASTGDLLDFDDINEYAQATGGVFLDSPAVGAEVVRPMPFTNLSTGGFSNSAGIYTAPAGAMTSSLNGQYVKITDTCGAISLAKNAAGDLVFGTSGGTDCTTPGVGGAGNTHSAREQFYQVNRIKEVARGWLPSNTWLTGVLTVNVNLNQTCNAYWQPSNGTLNFFKSGGGCANTGEISAVSLHELGHGLDQNDGNGSATEGGTGEAYGDTSASIALHDSCIGAGFLASNCSGYGDACTSCTGVRDIDFAKHSANLAATVNNYTRVHCSSGSGPCGKEVHCESAVASQTLWDLANRDLPSPGTGKAWTVLDRLWYLSRSTATSAFSCTTGTTFTSNGCGTGSWWKTMRAVDDDDGNLTNGTPHSAALFAAFNRHGIACTTDAGASTSFNGCTPPASPTVTATPGSNSVGLSWTSSGTAVYDVFRNERGCNFGFAKISNDSSSTSLTDNAVANGLTYFYQVVAQPSGNEACGSAPSTCVSVTPTTVACTPPGSVPTGVTATASGTTTSTVSWTAVSGASEYHILRSTTSGGPYTQVGTSTTTSFADSGLTCGTAYFYVVRAANSATCETGNSAQATTTTTACPTCTPPASAPTGVTATATGTTTSTVSWTAVSGATEYHVFRSTTSGGPYTQVGTSTTTSFADSGLTCGTAYFYVVRAANSATCETANSAQATATTTSCGTCTTHTLYSNGFETGTGLTDWTTGTFVSGGSTVDWRGIQTCSPAHAGTKIFRMGGTTCTAAYGNNRFSFAQPNGAAGVAVPAGATGTRLSFWHRRGFESGFDGGTVAVSVDGTNYEFVPATAIVSGTSYNGTVSAACPPAGAAGAPIFTGSAASMVNTTIDLDAACNLASGTTGGCAGKSVRVGFTTITDCSTTSTGWFLDDVAVTACTTP